MGIRCVFNAAVVIMTCTPSIEGWRVGEADPGVTARLRCAGKLSGLVDIGNPARADSDLHLYLDAPPICAKDDK